jgi:hypothetical protein
MFHLYVTSDVPVPKVLPPFATIGETIANLKLCGGIESVQRYPGISLYGEIKMCALKAHALAINNS